MRYPYSLHVNSKVNVVRVAFLVGVTSLAAGCGGIAATHSVSPATFFLPGLGQVEPPKSSPAAVESLPVSPEVAAFSAEPTR